MFKTSIAFALLSATGCVVGDAGDDDVGCPGGRCDGDGSENLEVANDLPDSCSSPEVVRIDRPVTSDAPRGDSFKYGFRFKAPTEAGAPVIVYLPGGPGQSSMENAPEFVPPGWGYLMTDPRGVGCNRLAALPEHPGEFFSTREIANDAIAAITDRKLTHYILFGISYGSALGTTVAHEIEARGLATPDAVVLEGVLGHNFGRTDADFPGAEYITQWHRVHDVLPEDVRTELDTADMPFGFTRIGWSKILMSILPMGPGDAFNLIASISTQQPADVRQPVLDAFKGFADEPPMAGGANELYRQVACRELMDTVPESGLDVRFDAGDLVRNSREEGTKCRELHVTTPYDSANLQFSTPLYLFIGDSDTATPASQGAYHFQHHTGAATRLLTKNGGHNSLELDQLECAPALMASIAAGGSGLDAAAAACPKQITIDPK